MTDPYRVLGVTPDASPEEIKQAYRTLAKKYHPDRYADSPLKDQAERKMQEINEAYDFLSRKKDDYAGYGGAYGSGYTGGYESRGSDPNTFDYIRRILDAGDWRTAAQLLDGLPNRSAEWYYLRGLAYLGQGAYTNAVTYIETAVSMDPSMEEYQNTLNGIRQKSTGFGGRRGFSGLTDRDSCLTLCAVLMLARCLCGDSFPIICCY